ncbi:DUF342 domain-containing protein [Ornithinibacillus scapharcae]|uniref:DUF342 domain-containing protein n=1 Tax=Ornithinibacillus scapharcae TaxID=1147159 RepID=UPI000225AA26|nr:FapA family protein [Ornithinibacillus scapharcae]
MTDLNQLFKVVVSKDHMIAELHYTDEYLVNRDIEISVELLKQFLIENKIVYGINSEGMNQFSGLPALEDFPVTIATGEAPVPGEDGKVHYVVNFNPEVERTDENWNFRDVMSIPSVEVDEKLATVSLPTEGVPGTDVYGNTVPAKPGKTVKMKAGKNVRFDEENLIFYSESVGQASVQGSYIHVHPVFEVRDSLSMKEGNLDFIGTIIVRGDVPSGFSLNAGGDIKIFGMVEAATLTAEGSIYIAEGFAGLQKGLIEAKENLQIGYINQGIVNIQNNLYVENSILHSDCIVGNELICQRGSIIGGKISAGGSIQVKHVGNHLNTPTYLNLGRNHKEVERIEELQAQKKEVEDSLTKLSLIGDKLASTPNIESNPKLFTMLQKQQASYDKNLELLENIKEELNSISSESNEKKAKLTVLGNIYGNTIVSFGKYRRVINTPYKQVEFELVRNEIFMRAL